MRTCQPILLAPFALLMLGCSGTYSPIQPSPPPDKPDPVLERRVIGIVRETFHVSNDTLPRSTDYFRDLRATNATHAALMEELGREFGITIPAAHAAQLRTIGQTVDYLQEALAVNEIEPDMPRGEQQERIPD
jgi:acyl carrier protein